MRNVLPQLFRSSRRHGFTLIETLTVACVTSLLLSVTVPAMQQSRMVQRDVDCKNNLKQIGLACHNYHDAHRCFPPGWISRRPTGVGHPSTGWQCQLLPYIEHAKLYNILNMTNGVYEPRTPDPAPDALFTTIPTFRCPTDAIGETNPLRGGWGTSNYVGNFGPHAIPQWSESEFWPGQAANPASQQQRRPGTGMFDVNSRIRIRDITDGTSATLMVGERCVFGSSGIWPGPRSNNHQSDVVADASYASPLNRSGTGFSSRHQGGTLQFVLCDGSVRRIHESIDSKPPASEGMPSRGILQLLAGKDDGIPVGNDW